MARRVDELLSFRGKADRRIEDAARRNENNYCTLVSKDPVHLAIKYHSELLQNVSDNKDGKLSPEVAVSGYCEVRKLRHDNWSSFLRQITNLAGCDFIDTKVGKFVTETLNISAACPPEIANKTPDILAFSSDKTFVVLGDIAVTMTEGATRARKHEKYLGVKKFIVDNSSYKVMQVDFILNANHSNLNTIVSNFKDKGLTAGADHDLLNVYKHYSVSCNALLTFYRQYCSDPIMFDSILDYQDKVTVEPIQVLTIPDSIKNVDTSQYEPIRTEEQIIEMIKDEVAKYDINDYFTNDINKTINAFDELVNENQNKPHMEPKSTIQVIDNSSSYELLTDHKLIMDYVDDINNGPEAVEKKYLLGVLPGLLQIKYMKEIYEKKLKPTEVRKEAKYRDSSVFGNYQYKKGGGSDFLSVTLDYQLHKGKGIKNVKKEPRYVDLSNMVSYSSFINSAINYYGSLSSKPPLLSNEWDSKTLFEEQNTVEERSNYEYCRSTNGAQLCMAMSQLYERITHLSAKQGSYDNIFVPTNASFICIMPKQHAPVFGRSCDMPFIYITRAAKGTAMTHIEYSNMYSTDNYDYYITKLSRLNVDKIANWSGAGYKLISTSSYIISRCPALKQCKSRIVGILTYMILDCHQKTSEFLDLLKYISFMPFSEIHRLPELVKDKFDLLIKTKLDAWMVGTLKDFIIELSKIPSLEASKPMVKTFNTNVVVDSLGLTIKLPTFSDIRLRHNSASEFIEEINLIYILRPKHLYGSQFMDKSITNTCEWNNEYENEVEKHKGWAVGGHEDTPYPFSAKFCYSSDAIYYAEKESKRAYNIDRNKVMSKLMKTKYGGYLHNNCSLRGCTKDKADRKTPIDLHTTSLDACLKLYEKNKYKDDLCTTVKVGIDSIVKNEIMQFTMSEKDQRGGGRPIATPTLGAKAALVLLEKPEASKGSFMGNNIIVPGKNKLNEQCETFKLGLSYGIIQKCTLVYQLTEDQSKYSENDNPRKYETYIRCNESVDQNTKAIQISSLRMLYDREHLVKRMPKDISENPQLAKYITDDRDGVKAIIGWPQGMLNFISTSVHSAADLWITRAFNKAYPDRKVYTKGLVHSDDSWVVVCCNHVDDFKLFALFRLIAKRLFCLKLNEKKLWGSKYMGELVSNYNLNGNVHLSVSKIIGNSFGSLTFQNWPIDVHNQVSTLQQCYRSGAGLGTLIMLSTILRQQLLKTYNVKGFQRENIHRLPIDIGGYPDNSVFELGVTGVACHYRNVLHYIRSNTDSEVAKLVMQCLTWSYRSEKDDAMDDKYNVTIDLTKALDIDNEEIIFNSEDFENLHIPSKGDVFRCVRHIMPKSRKLARTLKTIRALPFESDKLELIVTNPVTLSQALGHLKGQTQSKLYELATEKYTQSVKRLAISQAMQSSGKVVRIGNAIPMTFNEMYSSILSNINELQLSNSVLTSAFSDDNDTVECCYNIVHRSESIVTGNDKRKIINRMPQVEDRFQTIGRLSDVLLRLIDLKSNIGKRMPSNTLLLQYGHPNVSIETLTNDANLIYERFKHYFRYYGIRYACSLIMQQYLSTTRSKLWTQPFLKNNRMVNFLQDLYGKTINSKINYIIKSRVVTTFKSHDRDLVQSVYCVSVLNSIYDNSFIINKICGESVDTVLRKVDYANLSDNEYLKYAICMDRFTGNDSILRDYYSKINYSQRWVLKQKMRNRRYYGPFDVIIKSCNVVIRIAGEEGNLRLTANKADMNSILKAMRSFITKNYPTDSYNIIGAWGNCRIYDSKFIDISQLWLNYHGNYYSEISETRSGRSMAFTIDESLCYGADLGSGPVESFRCTDHLRVVHHTINGRESKMGNVFQNFSIPMSDNIELNPAFLQGFMNVDLLRYGVIEAVILNQPSRLNKKTIGMLLMKMGIGPMPLMNMFQHLLNKSVNLPLDQTYDDSAHIEKDNIEVVDIVPTNIDKLIEIHGTTACEDLASMAIDYCIDNVERVGKLYCTMSIHDVLVTAYCGYGSDVSRYTFIRMLLKNKTIEKYVRDFIKTDPITREELRADVADAMTTCFEGGFLSRISLDLYTFIIANKLNTAAFWDSVDVRFLMGNEFNPLYSMQLNELKKEAVKILDDEFICSEDVEEEDLSEIWGRPN